MMDAPAEIPFKLASSDPLLQFTLEREIGVFSFRQRAITSRQLPGLLWEIELEMERQTFLHTLVDLSQLESISRSGLLMFLAFREHAYRRGGGCVLLGAQVAVRSLLKEHRLEDRYLVCLNRTEAFRALGMT